ncbi:olfactory receptor 1019-like isoform X2 [Crotalus tigris]|uniref:olfactory receptor 1019-like isoform X2 n=1 Tax=Crotalus tigris TaxID=88082 RepID=UPI00192F1AD0|nr:olfactory receptor 1019-like isoform X2 [Crotalus tigris]
MIRSGRKMTEENSTTKINDFVFISFTNKPVLKITLFLVFLIFYMATLVGNIGMIALIRASPQLHTPMYFFLSNLSFIDSLFSSVVACKSLANLLEDKKSISFIGCAMQMYFVIGLGSAECFLLAAMAYDRYVAICKPLLYPLLMSPRVCILLMASSYLLGFLHSLLHTVFTFRLSFCQSEINHVYCDITALLLLSCTDTRLNELLIFYVAGLVEATTVLSVFLSYMYILANIVRISSASGRLKAFSTCTSHLIAVTIFHGAILILHFRPKSSSGSPIHDVSDKILAIFYTIIIPLLNPLIYSLRNKEVKDAFRCSWTRAWTQ